MVGTLKFTDDSPERLRGAAAQMDDRGVWHCDDEQIAFFLNAEYPPTIGPSVMPIGVCAFWKAKDDLKAEASDVKPPVEIPDGAVS